MLPDYWGFGGLAPEISSKVHLLARRWDSGGFSAPSSRLLRPIHGGTLPAFRWAPFPTLAQIGARRLFV